MGFTNPAALNISGNFGPWTTYTPTLGSTGVAPVMLAANRTGRYVQMGKLTVAHMRFAWSAIGAGESIGTGNYQFGLPVAAQPATVFREAMGSGSYWDASAGPLVYPGEIGSITVSVVELEVSNNTIVGAAVPAVPANGDFYNIVAVYEAA